MPGTPRWIADNLPARTPLLRSTDRGLRHQCRELQGGNQTDKEPRGRFQDKMRKGKKRGRGDCRTKQPEKTDQDQTKPNQSKETNRKQVLKCPGRAGNLIWIVVQIQRSFGESYYLAARNAWKPSLKVLAARASSSAEAWLSIMVLTRAETGTGSLALMTLLAFSWACQARKRSSIAWA